MMQVYKAFSYIFLEPKLCLPALYLWTCFFLQSSGTQAIFCKTASGITTLRIHQVSACHKFFASILIFSYSYLLLFYLSFCIKKRMYTNDLMKLVISIQPYWCTLHWLRNPLMLKKSHYTAFYSSFSTVCLLLFGNCISVSCSSTLREYFQNLTGKKLESLKFDLRLPANFTMQVQNMKMGKKENILPLANNYILLLVLKDSGLVKVSSWKKVVRFSIF